MATYKQVVLLLACAALVECRYVYRRRYRPDSDYDVVTYVTDYDVEPLETVKAHPHKHDPAINERLNDEVLSGKFDVKKVVIYEEKEPETSEEEDSGVQKEDVSPSTKQKPNQKADNDQAKDDYLDLVKKLLSLLASEKTRLERLKKSS